MASEAPSTERDGNRWALLYTTAPTLDPTAAQQVLAIEVTTNLTEPEAQGTAKLSTGDVHVAIRRVGSANAP